jgi:hypothetical protein
MGDGQDYFHEGIIGLEEKNREATPLPDTGNNNAPPPSGGRPIVLEDFVN